MVTVSPRPSVMTSASVLAGSRLCRLWSSITVCRLVPRRIDPASGASAPVMQLDQRRLARAIGSDDAEPVAAHDQEVELVDDRPVAEGFRHGLGLGHQLAGEIAGRGRHAHGAECAHMLAPVLAQLGEQVHAAHVALAPRGHAIAHPVFFGGDALGQQRLFGLFLRQDLVTPGLELGEAAVKAARCAAVQPDGAVGQRLEKAPVMADQHDGAAQRLQFRFQPFDGGKVEMVGGLVEQQDVGLRRQRAGDGGAADLAAREARGILLAAEAQIAQQADAAVRIVGRAEARLRHSPARWRSPRDPAPAADSGAWCRAAASARPCRASIETGGDLEQRRLARAVAPHEGDRARPRTRQARRLRAPACRRRSVRCRGDEAGSGPWLRAD